MQSCTAMRFICCNAVNTDGQTDMVVHRHSGPVSKLPVGWLPVRLPAASKLKQGQTVHRSEVGDK